MVNSLFEAKYQTEAAEPAKSHPLERAGIVGRFFATWTQPFIKACSKQEWQQEMHPRLPERHRVQLNVERIAENFNISGKNLFRTILRSFRPELIEFTIFAVIYSVISFSSSIFIKSIIHSIKEDIRAEGVLRKLILGFTGVALINLVKPILYQFYFFKASRLSFSVRSALISMVNSKILRTNLKTAGHSSEFSEGNVANLVQVDIRRLLQFFVQLFAVLYNFVSFFIGLAFLWYYVPVSLILVSLGFLVVVYSLYLIAFYLVSRFFRKLLEAKDSRMSLLKNVLKNLEFVKVAALENFFSLKIAEKREVEMRYLNRYAMASSFARLLEYFANDFLYFVIIVYYTLVGKGSKDASYGTYVVLFNVITNVQTNLYTGMGAILYLVRMRVSIKRLSDFLALEDLEENDVREELLRRSQLGKIDLEEEVVLDIQNGRFCWVGSESQGQEEDSQKESRNRNGISGQVWGPRLGRRLPSKEQQTQAGDFQLESRQSLLTSQETETRSMVSSEAKLTRSSPSTQGKGNSNQIQNTTRPQRDQAPAFELKDVSIKVKKGEKVFIFGDSSSGKSSLLYAILGEMTEVTAKPPIQKNASKTRRSAIKKKNGVFGLVTQQRWIVGDTIKNNIILALEYDDDRMKRCLENSQLVDDLPQFSDGLETVLGDTSDNISGGQKARIALARCFYQK